MVQYLYNGQVKTKTPADLPAGVFACLRAPGQAGFTMSWIYCLWEAIDIVKRQKKRIIRRAGVE